MESEALPGTLVEFHQGVNCAGTKARTLLKSAKGLFLNGCTLYLESLNRECSLMIMSQCCQTVG